MKYRFFYLLITNEIIANFILFSPYVLISQIYYGALIAIFAAFFITLIKTYFFLYVFNHFKNKTLMEINQSLFGNFFGNILSYIFILNVLVVGFFMYKGLVEIVKNYMLITSPLLLISVILIIIPFVAFNNTDVTFLQAMAFLTVIIIIWMAAQVILSFGHIQQDYLKGSIMHSIGIPKFNGITAAGFFFSGTYQLSLFNPHFKKISYKKTILLMALVGFTTAFAAVYIPISIWGPEAAMKLNFVWATTADTMSVDLFIIERVLFIMLPLFFLLAMSNAMIYIFVSYSLFRKLHPSPKLDKYLKLIICTIFVIGSMLIPDTKKVLENGARWMTIWYVFHVLLSVLLYIKAKGKEKSKK